MPRKRKRERTGVEPGDEDLVGTWWRCPVHGLTQAPILLGGLTYCPADRCTAIATLVHSALQDRDKNKRGWNDVVTPSR